MYPGKGTVVLIRPAQTFYERINIAKGQHSVIGGDQHALYRILYEPGYVDTIQAEVPDTYTVSLNGEQVSVTVLEYPLHADFSFVWAWRADSFGNLQYRLSQRNFNPIMAQAATVTIVEVEEDILEPGAIDPDQVHTPGIFVDRLVKIPPPPEGIIETVIR